MNKIQLENGNIVIEQDINSSPKLQDTINFTIRTDSATEEEINLYHRDLEESFNNEILTENPEAFSTESNLYMSAEEAIKLGKVLIDEGIKLKEDSLNNELYLKEKMIHFKNAHLACMKGEIGRIRIVYEGEVLSNPGFYTFSIEYYSDVEADDTLLYNVESIDSFVPPDKDGQMDWLRTLVGGNHNYTSTIAVELIDFSFEELSEKFNDKLNLITEKLR